MRKFFSAVVSFVRQNFLSCACFLLAIMVLVTGTISYSKYLSTELSDPSGKAGSFSCSANIADVSALSFTNTAFWGGSVDDDRIALNALRSLTFTVNNYQTSSDGKKSVASVRMKYSVVFSAPKNFVDKLAVQLFDASDKAVLPQIVLSDLMATQDGGVFDTSKSVDYQSAVREDMTMTVRRSATENGADSYLAESKSGVKITLEPFVKQNMEQTLCFRVWDVSKLTSASSPHAEDEGGTLLAPLVVKSRADVLCYRISFSLPQFILAAGVEETHVYGIRLAPTAALEDDHLGGMLTANDGNPVTEVYGGQSCYMRLVKEKITEKIGSVTHEYTSSVLGNPKVYADNEMVTEESITEYVEKAGASGLMVSWKEKVPVSVSEGYIYFNSDWSIASSENDATYRVDISDLTPTSQTNTAKLTGQQEILLKETATDVLTLESGAGVKDNGTIVFKGNRTVKKQYFLPEGTELEITRKYLKSALTSCSVQSRSETVWADSDTSFGGTADDYEHKTTTFDVPEGVAEETVTYEKKIVRSFSQISVSISSASRTSDNVTQEYTQEQKFLLYGQDEIQDYYLSQCYSKNYPFAVNVLFEQIQ